MCPQLLLSLTGCRTSLTSIHTQKTKSTQTQDGGEKKSLKKSTTYLHLTSLSPDPESDPEMKNRRKSMNMETVSIYTHTQAVV